MDQNICHFIPFHKDYHSIHTINFVLETKPQAYTSLKSESVYKMYYVCSGRGMIHTPGKIQPVAEGDIFFTFPANPFKIESIENFTYMYISFTGLRGNMIMERLKICSSNFLFHNASEVHDFWKTSLSYDPELSDLTSESVLLYTFAFLGSKLLPLSSKNKQNDIVSTIKKYIDDNFSSTDFSLEHISRELSYNSKYISTVFKKHMGIGVVEYLNTIRIQHACTMMEQGFTSVNDVANKCGYSDAQYFSKVFKKKMELSPAAYIKSLQEK